MFRHGRIVLATVLLGTFLVSVSSADARFVPGLDRVGSDEGEIYWKGCVVGHDRVKSGACRFGDRSSSRKVVLQTPPWAGWLRREDGCKP